MKNIIQAGLVWLCLSTGCARDEDAATTEVREPAPVPGLKCNTHLEPTAADPALSTEVLTRRFPAESKVDLKARAEVQGRAVVSTERPVEAEVLAKQARFLTEAARLEGKGAEVLRAELKARHFATLGDASAR